MKKGETSRNVEENLNKSLYKLVIFSLKYIPALMAICYFFNTILSLLGIDLPVLSYVAGLSLFPTVFMLLASFAFKFCICHRLFLYYCMTNNAFNILDYSFLVSLEAAVSICINFVIAFLFLILIIYHHERRNNQITFTYSGRFKYR